MSTTLASPATPTFVNPPTDARLRRFTVDEYQHLVEIGIVGRHEPVELIDGLLTEKMANDPVHASTVGVLDELLRPLVPAGYCCRVQMPVVVGDSLPEPDLAVSTGKQLDYRTRHPGPADLVLVVEVASSSLARDRNDKLRVYAAAGVGHYWVVNVMAGCVEVHTDPAGDTYRDRRVFAPGQELPLPVGGGRLKVADLFPPA